ncbi:MAG: hypothetical protein DCC49_12430 [Acidobacteria bacterium]|nr:MAG: hypothetical protein DCC49_12430 [Acidobacteriota bacterium]
MSGIAAMSSPPSVRAREFPLRDLLARTGAQKETVHFYLREGILPPPRRIGPRRSLYDDNHVELIELVRRLQRDPGLPLQTIKKMIAAADYSAVRLRGRIDSLVDETTHESPPDADGAGGLDLLVKHGALDADEPSEEALALGAWVESATSEGIPEEALVAIVRYVGKIVDVEAASAEADTIEIGRRAATQTRIFGEVIRWARAELLRRAGIGVLAEAPDLVAQLSGSLYRPSKEFLERHKVTEFLDALEERITSGEADEVAEESATLAIVMGDEDRLSRMIDALKDSGREDQALFLEGELAFFRGDLDRAGELVEAAVDAQPDDPSVWAITGLVRFAIALRSGSPRRSDLENARRALQAAEALEPPDLFRSLRTDFQLGRLYTLLPFDTRAHERAIGHLTSALTELRANRALAKVPGLVPAFSAQLLFYLGEARRLAGDRIGAVEALREVVAIDPDSNLGEAASLALAELS